MIATVLLSRSRVLVFRYVAMTSAALLVVLVYRRILHVNQTTVALTFLVMVQMAAFRWGLVYSVCLSVGCTLLYNFFFLPPIGSFTIADPQNWIASALVSWVCHFHQQDLGKRTAADCPERSPAE